MGSFSYVYYCISNVLHRFFSFFVLVPSQNNTYILIELSIFIFILLYTQVNGSSQHCSHGYYMAKTGETVWACGMMYKVVAQLVILYGSEIWVVTGAILKALEGFHHRTARWITEITAARGAGVQWEYPPVVVAMKDAVIHPIM